MKITRLKRGYVIRLSDTEYDVLRHTVDEGMGAGFWIDRDNSWMSQAERRIMNEVVNCKRDWMFVTEDRRITS